MIKISNISKKYDGKTVLEDINFQIAKGEVISCIGPSGSGKSTLLRCISRLTKPDSGIVEPLNLQVGMVFQNFNLFANKTVIENITLALVLVKKLKKDEAEKLAIDLLSRVNLEDKKDKYPGQLSGGQMQRIAVLRAIANKPDIMLFDEPTSALDPELSYDVLNLIRNLVNAQNLTAIIVTHEMNFAFGISDKIFFMENGKIVYKGTPDKIIKNERVAKFVSKMI